MKVTTHVTALHRIGREFSDQNVREALKQGQFSRPLFLYKILLDFMDKLGSLQRPLHLKPYTQIFQLCNQFCQVRQGTKRAS